MLQQPQLERRRVYSLDHRFCSAAAAVSIAFALAERAATSRLRKLVLVGSDVGDGAFAALGMVLAAQGGCASARGGGAGRASAPQPGLSVLELGLNPRVTVSGFRDLARGIRAAGPWVKGVRLDEYGEPMDDDMINTAVKAEGGRLLEEAAAENLLTALARWEAGEQQWPRRDVPIRIQLVEGGDGAYWE